MKRKFYIIGHNPNSARNAILCLKDGANALEPDIRYLPQYEEKFFVYDLLTLNHKRHTLKHYLIELSANLNDEKLNLALLAFDLKPTYSKDLESESVAYMKEFFDQLNQYFYSTYSPVPLLLTVGKPSAKTLLIAAKPWLTSNQAVGVDEYDSPQNVINFFTEEQMPFTFAAGTSSPFASPLKYKSIIKDAIALKQQTKELKLVYTWTANSENTMRNFIDIGVDGMITGRIARLKNLINTEYQDSIELATVDYNPFS
jgi:glycerophosphoryl diester phosphodiesterase